MLTLKKILYIATIADNRNRLDGETVKCKLLKAYLTEIKDIEIIVVDTDDWKKHIIKLVFLIIKNYINCDSVIVSAADNGAHIVLDFFRKINSNKDIYYFVVGGSLSRNIKEKNWNSKTYKRIKHIYVEANTLKGDLNKLDINNVSVLSNFRKAHKFQNNYKKSNTIRFVYFGRIIKKKGIEEAIKLINRLTIEGYKCSFDIYGQCEEGYLNKIKKDFTSNIRYNGEIKPNNKQEYETLSKYDVFLFPTEYPGECLPGALIDCYIAGLAVIASNWKYANEYILDNQNGKIFEYQNYEDMYDKTRELMKEENIETYKEKSKELAENYNLDKLLLNFKKEIVEDSNENY